MTVTSVNEMAVPNPLTLGKESNTFTRMYKVLVTIGGMQGAIEASTATGVPKIGDELTEAKSFSALGNAGYCTSISPALQSPESDYFHYIVTCTFEQNGSGGGGGGGSTDNSEAYTLSYSYDKADAIMWKCFNSNLYAGGPTAIVNSSGDPFSSPLRVSVPVLTINIQDTKSFYDPLDAELFLHTINDRAMTIAGVVHPKKSLMLTELSADRVIQNGEIVFNRTIKLTAPAKGSFSEEYEALILDHGFNEHRSYDREGFAIDVPDRQTTRITVGKNGEIPSTPQLLDGQGAILEKNRDPFFIKFEIFEETDFRLLNIPTLTGVTTTA